MQNLRLLVRRCQGTFMTEDYAYYWRTEQVDIFQIGYDADRGLLK